MSDPVTRPDGRYTGNGHKPPVRCFPVEPLFALIPGTARERAERLHVNRRQIEWYKHYGALTDLQADRAAAAIDLHPSEVWGDLWWTQADQEAAAS